MRLYDQWIDFVNLRCEEYTENSRIPTMVLLLINFLCSLKIFICYVCITQPIPNIVTILVIQCCNGKECLSCLVLSSYFSALLQKFGTAKEDAYRRDLTINRYSHLRQEQELA